jgi:hypothetical protein
MALNIRTDAKRRPSRDIMVSLAQKVDSMMSPPATTFNAELADHAEHNVFPWILRFLRFLR